jgi:S1-C subfamily serine protease
MILSKIVRFNALLSATFWMFFLPLGTLNAETLLPSTVDKVKPSIVAVGTYMPKRSPRGVFLGTGFVVGNGSLIVTNAHVTPDHLDVIKLEQLAVYYLENNQEKSLIVTEVAEDKDHDLSILKINGEQKLPPLKLGNVGNVREGELYAFTGFPMGMVLGLTPVTHRGIISAITPNAIPQIRGRNLNTKLLKRLEAPYNVFQLDATAYPGNSGSPLYETETGAVIGVINKVFVQESKEKALTNPSGISYAIPGDYIEKLLKILQ